MDCHVDREEVCPVDMTQLSEDAQFKGNEENVAQDLLMKTATVSLKNGKITELLISTV